jgi:hypothetical protein
VGGGALLNLIQGERHEVRAGAKFAHVEESNGFIINGDYFHHFTTRSTYKPYAGGGLNIAHFGCGVDVPEFLEDVVDCGATDAALELGGGIRIPRANGRIIFLQLLFAFFHGDPVLLSAGLVF